MSKRFKQIKTPGGVWCVGDPVYIHADGTVEPFKTYGRTPDEILMLEVSIVISVEKDFLLVDTGPTDIFISVEGNTYD